MQRRLFLCGPSGCGKTTMIRSALGDALAGAGGFVTERIGAPDGSLRGFELLPSAAAAGVAGFTGARFLDYTCDPPVKDNEVFRVEGVRLLTEAQYYPFALLDEIGGFELVIPQFRAALAELLNSPLPCIGVIKSLAGVEELQLRFGLGERFPALARQLRAALDADGDTLVLDVAARGDRTAEQAVREWAAQYAM